MMRSMNKQRPELDIVKDSDLYGSTHHRNVCQDQSRNEQINGIKSTYSMSNVKKHGFHAPRALTPV